jgi:DNA uptake protein ComE-like DNA-binding protein
MNFFSSDMAIQAKIDLLKQEALLKDSVKIYPFNPNFITDYKGYTLGMSIEEIDRLHTFRAKNKYVNSSKEFQKVTQVSDSLLSIISFYFKFPEWTKIGRKPFLAKNRHSISDITQAKRGRKKAEIKDLNLVSAEELKAINGIGEKLSARIIKFRDRLGGFLVDEQLYDVYGLEPEVVERALKKFKVLNPPKIEKININAASVEMLTKLIYLQKNVAINIVSYRDSKGSIDSFAELSNIENFPIKKIDRIALYLSL